MTFCWFFTEARSKLLASLAEFSFFGSERPAGYNSRQRDFGVGYLFNVPARYWFGVAAAKILLKESLVDGVFLYCR